MHVGSWRKISSQYIFIDYCLAADDVKKVLNEVGAEVDDGVLNDVVGKLKGKALHEIIAAGSKKVGSMSFGGGSGGSGPAQ